MNEETISQNTVEYLEYEISLLMQDYDALRDEMIDLQADNGYLREIVHQVWHMLDNAEEVDSSIVGIDREDLEAVLNAINEAGYNFEAHP